MDDTTLSTVRASLVAERARLRAELAEFAEEHDAHIDEGGESGYRDQMSDRGTTTSARELDMTIEDNVKMELTAVERAIERIDDGSYGRCRRCGTAIPDARLDAMPTADLCISCKEWEEGR